MIIKGRLSCREWSSCFPELSSHPTPCAGRVSQVRAISTSAQTCWNSCAKVIISNSPYLLIYNNLDSCSHLVGILVVNLYLHGRQGPRDLPMQQNLKRRGYFRLKQRDFLLADSKIYSQKWPALSQFCSKFFWWPLTLQNYIELLCVYNNINLPASQVDAIGKIKPNIWPPKPPLYRLKRCCPAPSPPCSASSTRCSWSWCPRQ